jgi:hypothetical protein
LCVGHLTDPVPKHLKHFQILTSQYYTAYCQAAKHLVPKREYEKVQ